MFAISIGALSPGYACSPERGAADLTDENFMSNASTVFVAHLTSAEEIPAPSDMERHYKKILSASFSIVETLKGEPPANRMVRSAPYGFGNCTIPLLVGADYIFFLKNDDSYITHIDGSSGPILHLDATAVQDRMRKLRSLVK
jgi:hypothetical protein